MQQDTLEWTYPTQPQVRKCIPVPESRKGAMDLLYEVATARDRSTLLRVFEEAGGSEDIGAGLRAVQDLLKTWHAGGYVPERRGV